VEKTQVVIREATGVQKRLSPRLWLFVGSEGKPMTGNLASDPCYLKGVDTATAIFQSS